MAALSNVEVIWLLGWVMPIRVLAQSWDRSSLSSIGEPIRVSRAQVTDTARAQASLPPPLVLAMTACWTAGSPFG